jgi:hypothetical protein
MDIGEPVQPAKRRRSRLRLAMALSASAAIAVAGGAAAVVVFGGTMSGHDMTGMTIASAQTTDPHAGLHAGAPQLLERIAAATAKHPDVVVRPDQFIYVESTVSNTYDPTTGTRYGLRADQREYHTRRIWRSADGRQGWLTEPGTTSADGEQVNSTSPASLGGNHAHSVLDGLPRDPQALLARIRAAITNPENDPDAAAFDRIGELLGEDLPPPASAAALLRAAARIPNLLLVNDAADAAGRRGVAVAHVDEGSGVRKEWIFDRNTSALLGIRTIHAAQIGTSKLPPGTVENSAAYLTRTAVDHLKQTP